jgi:hypothetical protein
VENPVEPGLNQPAAARSPKLRRALGLLWEAAQYAEETSEDRWQFSVEIEELRRLELSDNDLRYLIRGRFVDHAREISRSTHNARTYRSIGGLRFTKTSCFILAEAGRGIAADQSTEPCIVTSIGSLTTRAPAPYAADQDSAEAVPLWDDRRRTLFLKGQVVKRFRCVAVNQQTILSAFQEEGWPMRIDDPLSPSSSLVSKQRLGDTIKWLNRKQANRLLRFRGDGSGQGVVWESVTEPMFCCASA